MCSIKVVKYGLTGLTKQPNPAVLNGICLFTFLCQTWKSMTTKHWYISLYHRVPERDTKLMFLFLFLAFLWSCSDSLTPVAGYSNYKKFILLVLKRKKTSVPTTTLQHPSGLYPVMIKKFCYYSRCNMSYFLFIKINFNGINNNNRRSFLWLKSNQKGITSLFGFCFLEYDYHSESITPI